MTTTDHAPRSVAAQTTLSIRVASRLLASERPAVYALGRWLAARLIAGWARGRTDTQVGFILNGAARHALERVRETTATDTTDDLAPGWYWIRLDAMPPEIARRDAEAREWLLVGVEAGIPDDHPADIKVIAGPLSPPE
jgi:hypothetical protein